MEYEKTKRGQTLSSGFPIWEFLLGVILAFVIGVLIGFIGDEVLAQEEPVASEIQSEAEVFELGDTHYTLKVTPYTVNQSMRDMFKIELFMTTGSGYQIRKGVCFTESGKVVGPTDLENTSHYQDDWEFRIDRSINDAYGHISIPNSGFEDTIDVVFSCST